MNDKTQHTEQLTDSLAEGIAAVMAASAELGDTGDMVNPRTLPRVDLERYASERRTGGLGVHLMEKIMDSVTFRRSARRNVCCLVKRKR